MTADSLGLGNGGSLDVSQIASKKKGDNLTQAKWVDM